MQVKTFKNIQNSHKHIESFDVNKEYSIDNPSDDLQLIYESETAEFNKLYMNAIKDSVYSYNFLYSLDNALFKDKTDKTFLGLFKNNYAMMIQHNSIKIYVEVTSTITVTYSDTPYIQSINHKKKITPEMQRWGIIKNTSTDDIVGIVDYMFGNILLNFKPVITNVTFKNTHKIYTHEYLCEIKDDEFNFSSNNSLYDNETLLYKRTNEELYITTIGLYNDDYELLAVAKFAKPLKKLTNSDLGIIIKFDL